MFKLGPPWHLSPLLWNGALCKPPCCTTDVAASYIIVDHPVVARARLSLSDFEQVQYNTNNIPLPLFPVTRFLATLDFFISNSTYI
ncbi:hypothetical protein F4813DRAFT_354151 [Daldinia decipiens]|uniref:uncharacterized protein n=1 Tax=Daldinia decipiens TaxID=326647 RepID=UPI0020C3BE18|nr:uncharacterized protein F4813DRAFT_354151 [Daldinia decipiens]KAI1659202.1 hypothetical protein F4813DRAFT_354151 [Daldinia decipiens]